MRASLVCLVLVACGSDDGGPELAVQTRPIDGVTALPAGRIAVAWLAPGPDEELAEVAYDEAWPADAVTRIALDDVAAPSAALWWDLGCPTPKAIAVVVVSTDPDGSGSISDAEVVYGYETNSVYGIAQALLVEADADCAPFEPFFAGIVAGRHVYAGNEDDGFVLADGATVDLQTCAPGAPICQELEGPI